VPFLSREPILTLLLEKPDQVINLMKLIAGESGEYTKASFDLLVNPKMTALLVAYPGPLMHRLNTISASAGNATPIVFGFLGKEKASAYFERDPDRIVELFTLVGEETTIPKYEAFALFSNERFLQGFTEWPEQVIENLKKVADDSRPYTGNVFKILSKDRLAQAITELISGAHLATCLSNVVKRAGAEAPQVLKLFENDDFTKSFINDPYKQEQIVSHLCSFVGYNLQKAFEVLGDPEIAAVFSEDPSVLVTTRFRSYINGATETLDVRVEDAMDALLKDTIVKDLFISHVRQEFNDEGDPHMLKNKLLPALNAYLTREKRIP
jgi:hypothetical protein